MAAPVTGFPWADAILGGIGLIGGLTSEDKQGQVYDMLKTLAQNGVDVGKLVAPQLGAINKNFAEALTNRVKGLYSQGLGGSGAVEEIPLGFMEAKNYSIGQAYNQANAQNENIKGNALRMLGGMDLGGNEVWGQLAGYGGYNVLKHLLG